MQQYGTHDLISLGGNNVIFELVLLTSGADYTVVRARERRILSIRTVNKQHMKIHGFGYTMPFQSRLNHPKYYPIKCLMTLIRAPGLLDAEAQCVNNLIFTEVDTITDSAFISPNIIKFHKTDLVRIRRQRLD